MRWNLIYRLRKVLRWIWLQDGSPAYRARGVAIGVFCGCFPLFGFQTLLGVALAGLLRGNYLLAISGTWISNPLTYIPLYWFNYQIGSALLNNGDYKYQLSQVGWQEMWGQGWTIFSRLLLGSLLSGICLGTLFGIIIYLLLKGISPTIKLR